MKNLSEKFALVLCLVLLLTALASCKLGAVEVGSVYMRTPTSYKWSYKMFGGQKQIKQKLQQGQALHFDVKNEGGNLQITVTLQNEIIFQNDDVQTGTFQVTAAKDGEYIIVFKSERTAGYINYTVS